MNRENLKDWGICFTIWAVVIGGSVLAYIAARGAW